MEVHLQIHPDPDGFAASGMPDISCCRHRGEAQAAQVFVLPHIDSIAEFALLFMTVTAFASWVATASPRLSYTGVQKAFAFYITQLRGFGPQTSLALARNDVVGILSGLLAMWVIFDRIWAKNAARK